MKRRDIIRYTAFATGAVLSAPLMSVLVSGCKTDEVVQAATKLNLFSQEEFDTLKALVDTILPKTDSPSASDVGVHTMIDHMVGSVFSEEDKKSFKDKFQSLASYLGTKGFGDATADDKLNILNGAYSNASTKAGLQAVKQQTIAYYLSSEEIAKNYLNYLPVPGAWQSCISLEEAGGKKWAI